MTDTIETLNIRLEKQIEELENFKNDPLNEDFEDGIATLAYEINSTRIRILEEIAHNDSEKQIAVKLLAKI
jgi:hypothetical protein